MGIKLDLGCGAYPQPDHAGVDLYVPGNEFKVDLFKFPWPWGDNTVESIVCNHLLEYAPQVTDPDTGSDLLDSFMAECHRVLLPGAKMSVRVHNGKSDAAFGDPAIRRIFMLTSFDRYAAGNYPGGFQLEVFYQGADLPFDSDEFRVASTHSWNAFSEIVVMLEAVK
jgi:hypothetical protein